MMYSIVYAYYSQKTMPSSIYIDVPHTIRLYETGVVDRCIPQSPGRFAVSRDSGCVCT
jgi:hypothetical protein